MDYKNSGVDIEAGYRSVELMKEHFDSIKIESGIDKPRQAYLQYAVSLQEQFRAQA